MAEDFTPFNPFIGVLYTAQANAWLQAMIPIQFEGFLSYFAQASQEQKASWNQKIELSVSDIVSEVSGEARGIIVEHYKQKKRGASYRHNAPGKLKRYANKALLKALSSDSMVRPAKGAKLGGSSQFGIDFVDVGLLDSRAPQWYRLNFGTYENSDPFRGSEFLMWSPKGGVKTSSGISSNISSFGPSKSGSFIVPNTTNGGGERLGFFSSRRVGGNDGQFKMVAAGFGTKDAFYIYTKNNDVYKEERDSSGSDSPLPGRTLVSKQPYRGSTSRKVKVSKLSRSKAKFRYEPYTYMLSSRSRKKSNIKGEHWLEKGLEHINDVLLDRIVDAIVLITLDIFRDKIIVVSESTARRNKRAFERIQAFDFSDEMKNFVINEYRYYKLVGLMNLDPSGKLALEWIRSFKPQSWYFGNR